MNSSLLFGITAIGLVCSSITLYYVTRVKNAFAALPRLERPWLLLEVGVACLIVAVLTIPAGVLTSPSGFLHLVQTVAVVLAAFFILTAMVTMKQAWTIKEDD